MLSLSGLLGYSYADLIQLAFKNKFYSAKGLFYCELSSDLSHTFLYGQSSWTLSGPFVCSDAVIILLAIALTPLEGKGEMSVSSRASLGLSYTFTNS